MGIGSSTPAAAAPTNVKPTLGNAYKPAAGIYPANAPSPAVINRANTKLNSAIKVANSANAKVENLTAKVAELNEAADRPAPMMGGRRGRKGRKGRKTRRGKGNGRK